MVDQSNRLINQALIMMIMIRLQFRQLNHAEQISYLSVIEIDCYNKENKYVIVGDMGLS